MENDREKIFLTSKLLQLQKANAWWSNCAGIWRKRWMVMRNQRNQLRGEIKNFRTTHDVILLECTKLKEANNSLKKELEKIKVLKTIAFIEESFENKKSEIMYNKLQTNLSTEISPKKELSIEYGNDYRNNLKFQKIKTLLLAYCDQYSSIKNENESLRTLCSQILKMVHYQEKQNSQTSFNVANKSLLQHEINLLQHEDKKCHKLFQKDNLRDNSNRSQECAFNKWSQRENSNEWFKRKQSEDDSINTWQLFSQFIKEEEETCNENINQTFNAETLSTDHFEEINQNSDKQNFQMKKQQQVETDIRLWNLTKALEKIIHQNERMQDELKI
ncbi:coiled-coil domain-containing protein 102B [Hydra vulgaris]|uniref:coiled-coil domain-containing protein 102B n=1 Tax=Hydra vulgaris TaxID=6087 RepID=UPI000640D1CA|nr:coiled-coil domain-containing protein 102B [Hydra vulgaris]